MKYTIKDLQQLHQRGSNLKLQDSPSYDKHKKRHKYMMFLKRNEDALTEDVGVCNKRRASLSIASLMRIMQPNEIHAKEGCSRCRYGQRITHTTLTEILHIEKNVIVGILRFWMRNWESKSTNTQLWKCPRSWHKIELKNLERLDFQFTKVSTKFRIISTRHGSAKTP